MKCDNCNRPAVVHLTEIQGGKKIEKHLCEQCAAQSEAVPMQMHTPINELLSNFVMQHSGMAGKSTQACEHCGITWAEFRQSGLLGCEHDYECFEQELTPLLERAHEGATHHIGKVPGRRGGDAPVHNRVNIAKLRKELASAIEIEDYEQAARLRDQIREVDEG